MWNNKVFLSGRITADPELKTTESGKSVTSFSLAVNRRVAKDAEHPEADFINVVAWEESANFVCKYFTKGTAMNLWGRLQKRNYEDKEGNKRTVVEVVAEDIGFGAPKKENANPADEDTTAKSAPKNVKTKADVQPEEEEDELPF